MSIIYFLYYLPSSKWKTNHNTTLSLFLFLWDQILSRAIPRRPMAAACQSSERVSQPPPIARPKTFWSRAKAQPDPTKSALLYSRFEPLIACEKRENLTITKGVKNRISPEEKPNIFPLQNQVKFRKKQRRENPEFFMNLSRQKNTNFHILKGEEFSVFPAKISFPFKNGKFPNF